MRRKSQITITLQELIELHNVDVFENVDYDVSDFIPKAELEERFINAYYFREICYESYSMWKFKFKREWKNKIDRYNRLFEAWKETIDPLIVGGEITVEDVAKLISQTDAEVSAGESEASGKRRGTFKDTPITAYDESDYVSSIDNREITDESRSNVVVDKERESSEDRKKTIETTRKGNDWKNLAYYTRTLVDVVDMFIQEFNEFFIGIYA